MKKILAVLCAVALICGVLAGCGGATSSSSSIPSDSQSSGPVSSSIAESKSRTYPTSDSAFLAQMEEFDRQIAEIEEEKEAVQGKIDLILQAPSDEPSIEEKASAAVGVLSSPKGFDDPALNLDFEMKAKKPQETPEGDGLRVDLFDKFDGSGCIVYDVDTAEMTYFYYSFTSDVEAEVVGLFLSRMITLPDLSLTPDQQNEFLQYFSDGESIFTIGDYSFLVSTLAGINLSIKKA